ncbi:MAG: hypothetical protein NTZ83_05115 [Candidatus Pacearchaeota archaeon]|nr:hypothetical protein [Candidatus Pacearchaeota archaeon]
MKKVEKGKKRIYFIVAFVLILILASGVFAQSLGLSGKAREVVDEIVENQGIDKENIKSVEKVDFDNLPPQVDLKNIDTTNLAVYQVDYGGEVPVFVITASDELLETPISESPMYKMLLNFGLKGEISDSTFLNSATGVEGSLEKGYVMMRDGSITGLSTNLEVFSGKFEKGDVISVYLKTEGDVTVKDVINLIEIFTE